MIDMSKNYRTRSGYPVRVLITDRKSEEYPVVGLVSIYPDYEEQFQWTSGGELMAGQTKANDYDLIEA